MLILKLLPLSLEELAHRSDFYVHVAVRLGKRISDEFAALDHSIDVIRMNREPCRSSADLHQSRCVLVRQLLPQLFENKRYDMIAKPCRS